MCRDSSILQGGYCGLKGKNHSKNLQGLQSPYFATSATLKEVAIPTRKVMIQVAISREEITI